MAITQRKYINNVEHIWYESSNLVYSACYNGARQEKTLKVVFKNGRTYVYKDVDVNDYMAYTRTYSSNGSAFNTYIVKKYKGVRISDTDETKLEELRKMFAEEDRKIEEALSPLSYVLEINDDTGEFRLVLDGKPIYEGIEGQVSIVNLLSSMHIQHATKQMETPLITEEDFIQNPEKLELLSEMTTTENSDTTIGETTDGNV